MDKNAVLSLIMERQFLVKKAGKVEYEKLFRLMQPVQPVYWSCPGEPPVIVHRAGFNDFDYNFGLRAERRIIKGRFQNGAIAYIHADELELYAGAYRRKIQGLSFAEQEIFETIMREGPVTIQVIKEMTGMLVKHITPVLHKLQEAFLVFEDQVDNEWDRGWYVFGKEFPDADLDRLSEAEAVKELIMRFLYLNVFADIDMMKSFYRLPLKLIKEAAGQLEAEGRIVWQEIAGRAGWARTGDIEVINGLEGHNPAKSVFVLQRNDYLVKSNEYWLKDKFHSKEYDVLFYILIDGIFSGAVLGKFRNGPFDIGDIVLELPEDEKIRRKEEIITAVYGVNDPEKSPVMQYCGDPL